MASVPTESDGTLEVSRQTDVDGIQYGSSSDSDFGTENMDDEMGKDHIEKRLSLTFRDITVNVTAPDQALAETLWSRVDPRQLGSIFRRSSAPKRVHNHPRSVADASVLTDVDYSP
jgi:ATP-binding cassette, subfamily G (WHITE), member 2, SNQ2